MSNRFPPLVPQSELTPVRPAFGATKLAVVIVSAAYLAFAVYAATGIPAAMRMDATTACLAEAESSKARRDCYLSHGEGWNREMF